MTLPKEDWIKDTAWQEVHLTSGGWVKGTIRTEKGRYEAEIGRPHDCLMTVRSLEKIPTDANDRPAEWSEIRWHSRDVQRIETAQENWGVLPHWFPPLASDAQHPALKNIDVMKLPEIKRPPGAPAPMVVKYFAGCGPAAANGRGKRIWPVSRMAGWRAMRAAMQTAWLAGPQASPKGLRHGFGLASVSAGNPLRLARKWLCHAQLTAAASYIDAVRAEKWDIAHPHGSGQAASCVSGALT